MTEQTPSVGRIVHYCLSEDDCEKINYQRTRTIGLSRGNAVHRADIYPATIVRVNAGDSVNLQVHLDGPDTHWATSRESGPDGTTGSLEGRWFWPPRV